MSGLRTYEETPHWIADRNRSGAGGTGTTAAAAAEAGHAGDQGPHRADARDGGADVGTGGPLLVRGAAPEPPGRSADQADEDLRQRLRDREQRHDGLRDS